MPSAFTKFYILHNPPTLYFTRNTMKLVCYILVMVLTQKKTLFRNELISWMVPGIALDITHTELYSSIVRSRRTQHKLVIRFNQDFYTPSPIKQFSIIDHCGKSASTVYPKIMSAIMKTWVCTSSPVCPTSVSNTALQKFKLLDRSRIMQTWYLDR